MRPISIPAFALLAIAGAAACGSSDRADAGKDEGHAAGWPLQIESITAGKEIPAAESKDPQTCESRAFQSSHPDNVLQFTGRARTLRDNEEHKSTCLTGFRNGRAVLHVERRWKVELRCRIRGAVRIENTDPVHSSALARIILDVEIEVPEGRPVTAHCMIDQRINEGQYDTGPKRGADANRAQQRPIDWNRRCLDAGRYNVNTFVSAYADTEDDFADAEVYEFSLIEIYSVEEC